MCGVSAEFAPTRITQLNPAAWLAAGYNEQDTYEFLRNYADSMYHPNIRPPLTFRGGVDQQNVWLNLSAILTSTTTERWMAEATRAFTQSFQNTFVSCSQTWHRACVCGLRFGR